MATGARSEAHSYWAGLKAEYERYQMAVQVLPAGSERIQDDLRRYLCLRCAGFLEQVTYTVIDGYLGQKAGGPVLEFSRSWFKRAPNLNADAFTKLIARFGDTHSASFEALLTPPRRDALGTLLGVRNDVAHGKQSNGRKLAPERYLQLCEDVYDWLVETFLGDSIEVIDVSGKRTLAYESSP